MEKLRFLTEQNLNEIKENYETPCYVYSEEKLRTSAQLCLDFPNAY